MTKETLIKFAVLEWHRNPSFRDYAYRKIVELRQEHSELPSSELECLGIHLSHGVPLGKVLLDMYFNQTSVPQWQQARMAS